MLPYGPCPNGEDSECLDGETCVTNQDNTWSLCTPGECQGNMQCDTIPMDICADLPGDGQFQGYCVPQACNQDNPCPDGMECVNGFGMNPNVCVWPS